MTRLKRDVSSNPQCAHQHEDLLLLCSLSMLVVAVGVTWWYFVGGYSHDTWSVSAMAFSIMIPFLTTMAKESTVTKIEPKKREEEFASSSRQDCSQGQQHEDIGTCNESDEAYNSSITVNDRGVTVTHQRQQRQEEDNQKEDNQRSTQDTNVDFSTSIQRSIAFSEEEQTKQIAKYIGGRIMYADKTPAHVPAGETSTKLPNNFLDFCHDNKQRAQKQWETHQQWREERNVHRIHTKPDPCFNDIKKAYPHVCHGYSKDGWAVMYEHPGRMDLKTMFHSHITNEDIMHHDIFVLEYVANVLHPRIMADRADTTTTNTDWGMMGVLDLSGAKVSEFLSTDVIHYLTMISKVNDDHYPLHVKKIFMINAPFWMAHVFSIIKPVLPKTIVIEVLGSRDSQKFLEEYIDNDQLAQEFGGSSPYKLGEHPYELELVKLGQTGTEADEADNDEFSSPKDTEEATTPDEQPIPVAYVEETSTNDAVDKIAAVASSPSSDETRSLWPIKLPSLCSTLLSSSSREESDDEFIPEINSHNHEADHTERSSMRKSFVRTGGPLRPRLPSFEPVLSQDEEDRVMTQLLSSNNNSPKMNRLRTSTDVSTATDEGDNASRPGTPSGKVNASSQASSSEAVKHEDEEATDSFLGCGDMLWTSVLGACG
ncbi:SEC14 cytosolic factor [Seminavis robusta]|uniref:SEC14 cytosolic factor n=1 Tax=Seminavis robusta TaxID=568900 RepID=A0A9N8EJT6_9STRA|nr:SEC14 cytosolic factor [Seminavis robusta]|eukprot:Sro1116_g242900.1 SEC14 cytosolic factor (653) ;mRNA; r:23192-25150